MSTMPCYLKSIKTLEVDLKKVIKVRGREPTKVELKAGLKELLKQGTISAAKYSELCSKIDACVEVKGHTHTHEKMFA